MLENDYCNEEFLKQFRKIIPSNTRFEKKMLILLGIQMIISAIIIDTYIISIVMSIPELCKRVLLQKIQMMKSWPNSILFKKDLNDIYFKIIFTATFSVKDAVI